MKKLLFLLFVLFTFVNFANSQVITFSEDVTLSGEQIGICSEWNCYNNNSCYVWAKASFQRIYSYNILYWKIYKYKYSTIFNDALYNHKDWDYYNGIEQVNNQGQFNWAIIKMYFNDPGYYLIGVYNSKGQVLASGICKWNF